MKAAVLVLALQGIFSADPSWMPPTTTHEQTQIGHGLVTGVGAAVGAIIDGESGAKWGALLVVGYYLVREAGAQWLYRQDQRDGRITRQEYRKASWDSYMDVAYPLAVAAVPWTWRWKREAWPWWIASLAATVVIGQATDPGGYYSGMR